MWLSEGEGRVFKKESSTSICRCWLDLFDGMGTSDPVKPWLIGRSITTERQCIAVCKSFTCQAYYVLCVIHLISFFSISFLISFFSSSLTLYAFFSNDFHSLHFQNLTFNLSKSSPPFILCLCFPSSRGFHLKSCLPPVPRTLILPHPLTGRDWTPSPQLPPPPSFIFIPLVYFESRIRLARLCPEGAGQETSGHMLHGIERWKSNSREVRESSSAQNSQNMERTRTEDDEVGKKTLQRVDKEMKTEKKGTINQLSFSMRPVDSNRNLSIYAK